MERVEDYTADWHKTGLPDMSEQDKASITILITGASGLIGSHACKHFVEQGFNVRATVRNVDDVEYYNFLL